MIRVGLEFMVLELSPDSTNVIEVKQYAHGQGAVLRVVSFAVQSLRLYSMAVGYFVNGEIEICE